MNEPRTPLTCSGYYSNKPDYILIQVIQASQMCDFLRTDTQEELCASFIHLSLSCYFPFFFKGTTFSSLACSQNIFMHTSSGAHQPAHNAALPPQYLDTPEKNPSDTIKKDDDARENVIGSVRLSPKNSWAVLCPLLHYILSGGQSCQSSWQTYFTLSIARRRECSLLQ